MSLIEVPNLPGVPPLAAYGTSPLLATALLTADLVSSFAPIFAGPQWGIFLNGAPVVTADTVASFDFKQEFSLSDYPVEEGAFETYDKVYIPYDVRLRFAAGGSEGNRAALLQSIDAVIGDLNLYDAVTPEDVYSSVNFIHQSYTRTAQNGVGLLIVDVWCRHVMVTVQEGAGTNTAAPSGAPQTNNGQVQPTAPTAVQSQQGPEGPVQPTGAPPDNFPGQP